MQAEWTISTKPLELALDAISMATVYFAGFAHPIATGIGFFTALPRHSCNALKLRPAPSDSEEKIREEVARRKDLLGALAWKTLTLGLIYLDSERPENGFSMASVLAFFAGTHFCGTLARHLVSPSAIYVKQQDSLPDTPLVTCTVRTDDGVTVYEARS